jgi:hypothetical protein
VPAGWCAHHGRAHTATLSRHCAPPRLRNRVRPNAALAFQFSEPFVLATFAEAFIMAITGRPSRACVYARRGTIASHLLSCCTAAALGSYAVTTPQQSDSGRVPEMALTILALCPFLGAVSNVGLRRDNCYVAAVATAEQPLKGLISASTCARGGAGVTNSRRCQCHATRHASSRYLHRHGNHRSWPQSARVAPV